MVNYSGDVNSECLRCSQVISRVIDEILLSCNETIGETDGCCWEKRYGIQFPSKPCDFVSRYGTILSSISKNDKKESDYAKETWNKCIKSKTTTKHCFETGKCEEEPPGPENHNEMNTWCNKHFSQGNQTSCWECLEQNSECDFDELNSICLNMFDCRNDNSLNKINPPRGELLDCIKHFITGNCCNKRQVNAKNLNKIQKQQWWDHYVRTGGNKKEVK